MNYASGASHPPREPEGLEGNEDDQSQQSDEEEEVIALGRAEKRGLNLRGLRDLVPQLKHVDQPSSPQSRYFSLLEPHCPEKEMPFFPEVYTQVGVASDLKVNQKLKDPFRNL